MMRFQHAVPFCIVIFLSALISACSDGSGPSGSSDGPQIVGQVRDALTGEPIIDATLRTDPPSGQSSTDASGTYRLDGSQGTGGRFRVFVDHLGYIAQRSDITVADGEIRSVDFLLQREASGLVASTTGVQIPNDESSATFRLTTTVANTDWAVTTSAPWLQVEPSSGRLSRGEITFLDVTVQRSALITNERNSAVLALNAVGLNALVIDVIVEPAANPANERQNDCRLLDILRVGFEQYEAPLVRFPATARLPFDEGSRFIELPNQALFDSFIVEQPGDVTITHLQGGVDVSTLELFELDADDQINLLASNSGRNDVIKRAQVRQGLVPGIYCYALYGHEQPFQPVVTLHIKIDYDPLP